MPEKRELIRAISLTAGASAGSPRLTFEPTPVTVFVGPNNSGKSLLLRELQSFLTNGPAQPRKVLQGIRFDPFDESEVDKEIDRVSVAPHGGEILHQDHVMIAHGVARGQVYRPNRRNALCNPDKYLETITREFLRFQSMSLDGQSRLNLANDGGAANFLAPPSSLHDLLLRDNALRKKLRKIVYEAFGEYLVLDPTQPGTLRFRLSDREPDEEHERSFKEVAVDFHRSARPLTEYSDGVKAFVGILLMVLTGAPRILTIDEPEAFLHPSLVFKLAKEICATLADSDRRLFVATHSADFVMGCVAAGTKANVVRLTHTPSASTARLLPYAEMTRLMRKPMLRSAGALRGLFYQSVVVAEADADRAFYSEINERLGSYKPASSNPNCLFLNANGKDTISDIVAPMRALGVPTAAIVDLDVVEHGGTEWAKFMIACHVPQLERSALENTRHHVRAALNKADKDYKRKGGIDLLQKDDKEAAQNFLNRLAEYGLFVVARGEVENWLAHLPLNRSKHTWLHEVFEKIGDAPDDKSYVKPTDDDVWKFLSDINHWLGDGSRKGIPS